MVCLRYHQKSKAFVSLKQGIEQHTGSFVNIIIAPKSNPDTEKQKATGQQIVKWG